MRKGSEKPDVKTLRKLAKLSKTVVKLHNIIILLTIKLRIIKNYKTKKQISQFVYVEHKQFSMMCKDRYILV